VSILTRKPDYIAARLALAELKVKGDDTEGALADLREAARAQPGSELIFEQIGDLEKARGKWGSDGEVLRNGAREHTGSQRDEEASKQNARRSDKALTSATHPVR